METECETSEQYLRMLPLFQKVQWLRSIARSSMPERILAEELIERAPDHCCALVALSQGQRLGERDLGQLARDLMLLYMLADWRAAYQSQMTALCKTFATMPRSKERKLRKAQQAAARRVRQIERLGRPVLDKDDLLALAGQTVRAAETQGSARNSRDRPNMVWSSEQLDPLCN